MDENEFESWFVPRIRSLNAPLFTRRQQLRIIAGGLALLAVVCFIAWLRLK